MSKGREDLESRIQYIEQRLKACGHLAWGYVKGAPTTDVIDEEGKEIISSCDAKTAQLVCAARGDLRFLIEEIRRLQGKSA